MFSAARLLFCGGLLFPFSLACAQSQPQTASPTEAATAATPPAIAGLRADNYPRVNGSSSTAPLGQLVLARALGLAAEVRRSAPSRYSPEQGSWQLSFPRDTPPQSLETYADLQRANEHRGTHESYEALINGRADLILVARAPSPDELQLAAKSKVALQTQPVARDALVFVVNGANPVKSLTSAQLRAIFAGQTTRWNAVGGANEPIRAYTRNSNSGSEELMRALLMNDAPLLDGGESQISSMAGLLDAIARNPRALGYSLFYYETTMNPRAQNKTLAVDGIAPSRATIAQESYPLISPVYIVTRGDLKPDAPAAILRAWLLSAAGQELVEQSGYVPLQVE